MISHYTINDASVNVIALGANLSSQTGDLLSTLNKAIERLSDNGVKIIARSRWYATPAFPPGSGPDFVNGAVLAETDLAPEELLSRLQEVEASLGRERHARWEPRVCDLDLIAVGASILPDRKTWMSWRDLPLERQRIDVPDTLILPHPRMQERAFVLCPMNDITPEWRHPVLGLTVREMLEALPPESLEGVRPL